MRNRTKVNELYLLPAMLIMAVLAFSPLGLEKAHGQSAIEYQAGLACDTGFAGIWLIDKVCDLGGQTDLKAQDAIHIQCDNQTGQWSVDFYEEADLANPVSQATQYKVCPGNGYLAKDESGKLVLQCNYWESVDNVSKQLEFALKPMTKPGIENMGWLSREIESPNVVCGIAGRPEGGQGDSGGAGRTINDL